MFHWFGTVTNTRGDSLPGWQVECVQLSDGETVVPIFADENGTPIVNVTGIANRAVSGEFGNYDFYVPSGTYSLRFYNEEGDFQRLQRFLPMYGDDVVNGLARSVSSTAQVEDLDTSRFTKADLDGSTFILTSGDFSTQVAADTLQGIYIAPSGEDGSTRAWVRQTDGVVRPEWFGDLDTPATNHLRIQAAIDMGALLGFDVVLPPRTIEFKSTLYARDNNVIRGAGMNLSRLLGTKSDGSNGTRIGMQMGEGHPAYLASNTNTGKTVQLTYHNMGAIIRGSRTVTLSTPAEAGTYSVGDKIIVRTRAYYRGSNNSEVPHFAESFVVRAADAATGVIELDRPLRIAGTTGYVGNFTAAAIVGINGVQIVGPVVGVKLSNFTVETADPASNAMSRTHMIGCTLENVRLKGPTGIYVNSIYDCDYINVHVEAGDRMLELANGSVGNRIEAYLTYNSELTGNAQVPMKLGEASHYNTLNLWASGDYDHTDDLFTIKGCTGNAVRFHNPNFPRITRQALLIASVARDGSTDAGETQDRTDDNTFELVGEGQFGTGLTRFVYIADTVSSVARNHIIGGKWRGTPSVDAVRLGGQNTNFQGWLETGRMFTDGVRCKFDVIYPQGSTIDYSQFAIGNIDNGRINGVDLLGAGETVLVTGTTHDIDLTKPIQTIVFSGASLQFGSPAGGKPGAATKIRLVRVGATVTPTQASNAVWLSRTWPEMEDGEAITFTLIQQTIASGANATRVAVINETPPV